MISQAEVEWTLITPNDVGPGDVVSADAGGMPIYRVLAVEDGQAWLQDDIHPEPQRLPLHCLHWKACSRH